MGLNIKLNSSQFTVRHRTNSTFNFVSKRDSPRSTRGALHGLDLLTFVLDDSTNTAMAILFHDLHLFCSMSNCQCLDINITDALICHFVYLLSLDSNHILICP